MAKVRGVATTPLVVDRAKGVHVWDLEGRDYIDLVSSAAVMNTGYNHDRVVQAIQDQIGRYIHFSNDYFYTKPQIDLADKLQEVSPGRGEKKVIYGFAGSDSIDTALKLARAYTGRSKLVGFTGAYHGSTYGAISLSASSLNMARKIGPLLPDTYHLPYPLVDPNLPQEDQDRLAGQAFEDFLAPFQTYIPKEEVAGILIEAIAGDKGIYPAPRLFMEKLADFCHENGILLIVDEIQQGFGRTGAWFSIDHYGIEPDILVCGKAMASGLPMSAAVARPEIIDSLGDPGQLFTLEGNAVTAAAALATIEVIQDEDLLDRAWVLGEIFLNRLNKIQAKSRIIQKIRGIGLSIGVDLADPDGEESPSDLCKKICWGAYKNGLILLYLEGKTLRIQPPLVMTDQEANQALDKLDQVFMAYEAGKLGPECLEAMDYWEGMGN